MNNFLPPVRPAVYAEKALVTSILDNTFPPGSNLPAERELAATLGVTRPTLREALRRLQSDGWLDVQQGKPTRVRDFWREGGLNVLSALVRYSQELPDDFIENLLDVRLALAPIYTHLAVERSSTDVAAFLGNRDNLPETPEAFASFDWQLHYTLTVSSCNPIYTLILNGFAGFYEQMARAYFAYPAARQSSRRFYQALFEAAQSQDADRAESLTKAVMRESILLWEKTK